jgi:geranylgeranyl pyrophosphate synthase
VSAACTLVYLGADLLDNVADDELDDAWRKVGPPAANLAGVTYLASLTGLMVSTLGSLGVDERTLWKVTWCFSRGMLEMSVGQERDLFSDDEIDLDACLETTHMKAGAEFAMFARAAALPWTDEASALEALEGFGRCLAVAGQLASDLHDIWRGPGQDLVTGKRTLPIVHALGCLKDGDRDRFVEALRSSGESAEARAVAKALMVKAGSISYVALVIEVQRRKGLRFLEGAPLARDALEDLRALIDRVSPMGPKTVMN